VSGTGSAQISGAATLEFAGLVSENIQFAQNANGTLKLDQSANFTGSVSNLGTSNKLDLVDIAFAAGATVNYVENQQATGGTLTVSDGTHTANVALLGQFSADGFQAEDDRHLGTQITYHPLVG
jgi:large repetitive protein